MATDFSIAILYYAVYVMHFTICIISYMKALGSKLDRQDSPFINDTIVTADWIQIFMAFPDSGLLEKRNFLISHRTQGKWTWTSRENNSRKVIWDLESERDLISENTLKTTLQFPTSV